jgi:diaminopimelate decarboxylase
VSGPLPTHGQITGYAIEDNCLKISGSKVTDILHRVGTPAYIYDSNLIVKRVRSLRTLLPDAVRIHYAMKANPMPEVVALLATLVDGIDVASGGELAIALKAQVDPDEVSFAGPGKRDVELTEAVRARIVVNVESRNELERISRIAASLQTPAKIAIRVNPAFELKSSGMRMSGGPKPFGIDSELVPEILNQICGNGALEFRGFHIFTGSQSLNADAITEAQESALNLALQLARSAPIPPKTINIGGGFGIPMFANDSPLDVASIGRRLASLVERLHRLYPNAHLVLELGRYLVGEAGIYACEVVDKKVSRGHTYLVTNGGLHHHLSASGNFGQVLRKNFPVLIGNRVNAENKEKVTIVGPLCTPLDIIADNVSLPEASVGDIVVVMQSGAYGFTASPRSFLSHPSPAELLT